jgi:hypothetical protein
LTGIGLLRARMGLSHAPYWNGSVANDFSISADDEYARYAELKVKVARAVRVHDTWQQVRRMMLWSGGISLVTGAGVALLVFAPDLF